jgi:hypothetical protein
VNEGTIGFLSEYLQSDADAQPMTVYCSLCPKWEASGTAGETRAASQEHRAKKHPELARKGVVRKRRQWSNAMTEEREAQIDEERRQRMRALGLS